MVKRITIVLLIILGVFISFSLYRTYAYNTTVVEETPSATDLEYTFKIGDSSIKEITISSGETKYYDIVLGNPNNAKISYSIYYEMVSPNTKPDNFSIEYTSKSTGDSTGKVDKNGNITLNLVVTNTSSSSVTVKLGSIAGYVNGGELVLSSGQEVIPKKLLPATSIIEALDDGTTGDSGSGVYKVEHDAIPAESSATGSEIPATTDYRYYGASPNNYVCLDNSGGTCEDRHLYRIIGSIYEENAGQNLLKVIKATPLTDGNINYFCWDMDSSGHSSNIWSTTTSGISSGSQTMKLLNGIWLTRGSGSYYEGYSSGGNTQSMEPTESIVATPLGIKATPLSNISTVNFTNYGPSDKAQSLINTTSRYYLGGYSDTSLETPDIYLVERGTITSSGNSKYWDGKIALMYPSDYGYAAGNTCVTEHLYECYSDKNWLDIVNVHQWTITPDSYYAGNVWSAVSWFDSYPSNNSFKLCPTFYLSKDVVITGGTGTSSDPYLISK